MNVAQKYVRHSIIGVVIWPRSDSLFHSDVGAAMQSAAPGRIVSAGFVSLAGGKVSCWGRSESLNLGMQPDDGEVIARQLGLDVAKGG